MSIDEKDARSPPEDGPDAGRALAAAPMGAIRRQPRTPLFALAFAAAAVLLVVLLGLVFAARGPNVVDRAIILAMREPGPGGALVPAGPDWLPHAMANWTALGAGIVMLPLVGGIAGLLLLRRHWLTAALLAASAVSSSLTVSYLKDFFGRVRPDLIDQLAQVSTKSFPSAHAANSAAVYLTLAILLGQLLNDRAQRRYLIAAAAILVLAIGSSRVYLGVHWPSDVLSGWMFGIFWALAWCTFGAWLRHRRLAN